MLRKMLVVVLAPLAMLFVATAAAQSHRDRPVQYPVAGYLGDDTDQCFFSTDGEHPTSDFGGYGEEYTERFGNNLGATLDDDGLACVGLSAVKAVTHTEGGGRACDGNAPIASSYEDATFADGEEVLVCDVPDVRLGDRHDYINSRGQTFNLVAQGFKCDATVMTGASGSHLRDVSTKDSVQFDETYTTLNGNRTAAITTACVGRLPASTPPPTSVQTDQFACAQTNPLRSGTITSYGTSYTFPNRQYEQICEIPKTKGRR